ALPGPNLTHSRWGTIWPYAGRNHGHKMRHKWPPVGSLRWPSTQTKAVSTLEIRNDTYGFAWDAIRAHPLSGVGLNAANAASFDNVTVVHNVFLRSWYQGGVVLALAVGLIICATALVAFRSMKSGKNAAAAGVLVAMMTFALTSAFFEQAYYWLPVVLAFACLSAGSDRTASFKAHPRNKS
ncbi:O-antigen ligase family protein, partial [Rhodococcus qingshengii]|nr:O-antigen ligase family protein [Rhodococcus qingshengii]